MSISYYQINSRQLTTYHSLTEELRYDPNKNYLFDLAYLGGLHVVGERASEFLQGQLSCDLRKINEQQMRKGALCDLKGRILALSDVIYSQQRGFQLILPLDLIPSTKTSLAKPAMFSRVTLKQATNYRMFGFYMQDQNDLLPIKLKLPNQPYDVVAGDDICCYCLGNNFYIFLVAIELAQTLLEPFAKSSKLRGSLAWHELQLKQKRLEIYPESTGLFLPHRLGLQLTDYLSFEKGCYKGQEIIARTHYRAKLKHELKIVQGVIKGTLRAGQKIFDSTAQKEIGELVDFCPIGKDQYLLAVSVLIEHSWKVRIEEVGDLLLNEI